jgi:hypothetical protein
MAKRLCIMMGVASLFLIVALAVFVVVATLVLHPHTSIATWPAVRYSVLVIIAMLAATAICIATS